ncbi:MAG TPA: hypothetical protein VD837_00865 [Terriglobales bacterium]|nr:hypothetical protein [Terriglobales bacterium]
MIQFANRQERTWLTYLTVAIVSFAGLTFELVQTRVLSHIFWNHVVYLAISIALLGFGISGTVVILLKRRELPTAQLVALCTALMSFSMLASVFVISLLLPAVASASPAAKLMICYLISVPPFIFAGAAISLILAYSPQGTGKLYFCDLIAAGVACAIFFKLLPGVGAVQATAIMSLLVAGCALAWAWVIGVGSRKSYTAVAAVAIVASIVTGAFSRRFDYRPEPYKEMGDMMAKGAQIERTQWTTLARIDVVSGANNGQVLNYSEHPEGSYKIITQDGSAHTRLLSGRAIHDIFDRVKSGKPVHPSNLPYTVLHNPDVAIIGTGGGIDVAYALANNANSVLAVELNPYTYSLPTRRYAEYTDNFFSDPRIRAINAEGRNAIRSTDKKFDLIQIIAIDTFAALNAGAYVLSENYLYTVEAFQDFITHLKPGGVVAMYRWNSFPPRETLRLSVLASQAFRNLGVRNVSDRIMVIGDQDWALTVVKNGSFTQQETERLGAEAARVGREVFYWPKVRSASDQAAFEEAYYGSQRDSRVVQTAGIFNSLLSAYDSGNEAQFFRNYRYKVTPTTDDSPFFFESSSLADLDNWSLDTLRGSSVQSTLMQILIASTIAMLCAIFVPLMMFHREGMRVSGARGYTVYFSALGFGFMLVEIALMQKSVLVLGNPMYSIPAVLSSILLSAGVGSAVTSRWHASFSRKIAFATILLVISIAGFMFGFTAAAEKLLQYGFAVRATAVVVAILPIGFALGFFFPSGLQFVRDRARVFVPWAWGINGCASVYGSLVATVAAMWQGFNVVLAIGIATYLVALIAGLSSARVSERAEVIEAPVLRTLKETA